MKKLIMISVILPTYNSVQFLTERLITIINQTYTNWECIVIDGFSSDGTWEELIKIANNDTRFLLFQYPAKGPYDAWNKGIELAKGEYIYIATSDDTMSDNILQVMYENLISQPSCKIAHCKLSLIDKNGALLKDNWDKYYPSLFYGSLMNKYHIRQAPLDGILYCGIKTIYTSITQLLIKKEVFEYLGLFKTDEGSIADFEWGLRVGTNYNILHIPLELATWRKHDEQLTTNDIQTDYHTYTYLYKKVKEQARNLKLFLTTIDFIKLKYYYLNDFLYYYLETNNSFKFRLLKKIITIKKSNNIQFIQGIYYRNKLNRLIKLC